MLEDNYVMLTERYVLFSDHFVILTEHHFVNIVSFPKCSVKKISYIYISHFVLSNIYCIVSVRHYVMSIHHVEVPSY